MYWIKHRTYQEVVVWPSSDCLKTVFDVTNL